MTGSGSWSWNWSLRDLDWSGNMVEEGFECDSDGVALGTREPHGNQAIEYSCNHSVRKRGVSQHHLSFCHEGIEPGSHVRKI